MLFNKITGSLNSRTRFFINAGVNTCVWLTLSASIIVVGIFSIRIWFLVFANVISSSNEFILPSFSIVNLTLIVLSSFVFALKIWIDFRLIVRYRLLSLLITKSLATYKLLGASFLADESIKSTLLSCPSAIKSNNSCSAYEWSNVKSKVFETTYSPAEIINIILATLDVELNGSFNMIESIVKYESFNPLIWIKSSNPRPRKLIKGDLSVNPGSNVKSLYVRSLRIVSMCETLDDV